jgi:hypothetical protein
MSLQDSLGLVGFEFSTAYAKYNEVFYNASPTIKEEMKKHLIYDSDLHLDAQVRSDIRLN